jgi:hypothetical protein
LGRGGREREREREVCISVQRSNKWGLILRSIEIYKVLKMQV